MHKTFKARKYYAASKKSILYLSLKILLNYFDCITQLEKRKKTLVSSLNFSGFCVSTVKGNLTFKFR